MTLGVASPVTLGSGISVTPVSPRWGVGPYAVASRTPSQGSGGTGAPKRRSPTGASANGMPRKAVDPARAMPRTAPLRVRTTGPGDALMPAFSQDSGGRPASVEIGRAHVRTPV